MGYLYRFLDAKNNILYVGKTNKTLVNRLHNHHHLPTACYQSISKIEYKEIDNDSDLIILENYYINQYLPFYNTNDKGQSATSLLISDSYPDWENFNFKACGINIQKHIYSNAKSKEKLTIEERKKRQLDGIAKAKEEGKYKGRKRIDLDKEEFSQLCSEWRSGERTAKSIYKKLNISSQTFYRRVHEWNL